MEAPRVRIRTFKPLESAMASSFMSRGPLRGTWAFSVPLESARSREVLQRDPNAGYWTRYSWMYKADAVVDTPEEVWLVEFEVKPRFALLARLKLYEALYREQFKPTKPRRLGAVYLEDAPDTVALLRREGVTVWKWDLEAGAVVGP